MNSFQRSSLAALSSLAVLLALGACNRADQRTAGARIEADRPGVQQTAEATKRESQDAAASAASSSSDDAKAMGAAAAAKPDDRAITAQVNAALAADPELSAIGIDVDTQDGVVTLSGPAPTATAKEHAAEVARNVKGVTSINNQLTLKSG